jgi:outer membrane murein-binding lipoprotein Lpp
VTNTLKLVLATVVGATLTISSLSATEKIEKINAFKNITTQAVSVEELNLLSGQVSPAVKAKRKARRKACKDMPANYQSSVCDRGFLGIGFKNPINE